MVTIRIQEDQYRPVKRILSSLLSSLSCFLLTKTKKKPINVVSEGRNSIDVKLRGVNLLDIRFQSRFHFWKKDTTSHEAWETCNRLADGIHKVRRFHSDSLPRLYLALGPGIGAAASSVGNGQKRAVTLARCVRCMSNTLWSATSVIRSQLTTITSVCRCPTQHGDPWKSWWKRSKTHLLLIGQFERN